MMQCRILVPSIFVSIWPSNDENEHQKGKNELRYDLGCHEQPQELCGMHKLSFSDITHISQRSSVSFYANREDNNIVKWKFIKLPSDNHGQLLPLRFQTPNWTEWTSPRSDPSLLSTKMKIRNLMVIIINNNNYWDAN